ncbi:MAG TPA: hypothetical protein VGE18_03630 [Candidatus Paceibacterota bacterium]
MDQPELQGDETIRASLAQLEQDSPMPKTLTSTKPALSPRKNAWLLVFVALALIVSTYLFLSLGNSEPLTDQEEQILREGRTQQYDNTLFNN